MITLQQKAEDGQEISGEEEKQVNKTSSINLRNDDGDDYYCDDNSKDDRNCWYYRIAIISSFLLLFSLSLSL